MAVRNPADIRNIVITGHGNSGKTTLCERLLFATKAITRMGSVEEGNTVSDWSDEEKHHKHSLRPSVLHFEHEGHWVNIIDTPGRTDFLGQAIACFPAAETVAVVIDAVKGIESSTRRLMTIASDRRLPRVIIVNKIDHPEADLEALTERIRSVFGPVCLPINLPSGGGAKVINVLEHDGSDAEGDSTDFSSVHDAHQQIVEQIVEVQDELMTTYLEKGNAALDGDKVHDALEQALRDAHLVPICYCSARTGVGIDDLLHIFASLLPSPLEGNPRPFLQRVEDSTVSYEPKPDPELPLLAHLFKITVDPFVGKLGVFKVHQGVIKAKSEVLIGDQKKPLRIGHLLKRQGKESVEVEAIGPGDIGAISKLDELVFDAVLHTSHDQDTVHLKPLPLPSPMYGLAIELKNHADETKFSTAIQKLCAEDPFLRLDRIAATRQTVLQGMGELHLRVVLEKLQHQFNIELITSPPKVAYKETITANADGHHRHKKQTGGAGQFGEVFLRVEPLPPDHPEGFEFVNETFGGSIPRQFMPAIEKGCRQVISDGAVAGYPMRGIRVCVTDGKYHAVDSKEIAFITAGKYAFIDAVAKARPVLLEPIVLLEVTCPSQFMGDITGDLSTRRGRVQDTEMLGEDVCLIKAHVPLAELQTYSTQLKSMTGGAGSYTIDFSHDEPTPPHIQQEVIAAYKPHHHED
ncbi:MAG: elongation factor G [Phycisphaeraceae bacterium]|nr:elongation factor G [Phycisphaeraceae bacterium]MCW5755378.1 elongation factor G [Phycisphaeraceae bacterium]